MGRMFNEDGSVKDRDALRSIGFGKVPGGTRPIISGDRTKRASEITSETDGKPNGVKVESKDGSQSVRITRPEVTINPAVQEAADNAAREASRETRRTHL